MKFRFPKWFGPRTEKASTVTPIIAEQFRARALWKPDKFKDYAKEGYSENTAVYACINEISRSAAGIGWILKRKGASGDSRGQLIDDHPLLNLLRRPNEFQGGSAFIESVTAYLLISGNSYIERVGPDNGPPIELFSLRPDRFKVIPDQKNMVAGYRFTLNGQSIDFLDGEIFHKKLFNPLDEWYGLSPVSAAAIDIDSDSESKKWNLNLAKNDMKPPGGFTAKEALTEDQFKRLKSQLNSEYAGASNAGKQILLEGGLEWTQFSISQKDADWIKGMKISERRIYNIFQVPGELVGDSENKTYSNYREARKSFYMETVLPYMDGLRDDFNAWLTPLFGDGIALDYDRDGIEAIQSDRAELFSRVSTADWLTINEKRIETGFEEIEGGDVIFVPMGMVALNAAGEAENNDS